MDREEIGHALVSVPVGGFQCGFDRVEPAVIVLPFLAGEEFLEEARLFRDML